MYQYLSKRCTFKMSCFLEVCDLPGSRQVVFVIFQPSGAFSIRYFWLFKEIKPDMIS